MEKITNFLNHVLPKILSVILVFLIFTSMVDSNLIQGCAKVINYTASVRGGSQRIVKLAIVGEQYSDLISETEIVLNELKKVNDALGHQAGDQMLKGFAHLLRKAVPIYDFVGRYGGDEFVAILTNVSPEDVQRFLEKLKRMTEEYNRSGTQLLPVIPLSYAAGYAHSANVENSAMPALLRLADYDMYRNKTAKKIAMGLDPSSR